MHRQPSESPFTHTETTNSESQIVPFAHAQKYHSESQIVSFAYADKTVQSDRTETTDSDTWYMCSSTK